MKTDAVMCMALTRQSPSRTPLCLTSASIFGVMLMKPRRSGTSNQRYSVSDFTGRGLPRESSRLLREPSRCQRIGRAELEEKARDFLPAAIARVHAVSREVV